MGFPTDVFLTPPDENLLCAICYDVLEEATGLHPCGHAFCNSCLVSARSRNMECPTCRVRPFASDGGMVPNIVLRGMIGNLMIRCQTTSGCTGILIETGGTEPGPSVTTEARQENRNRNQEGNTNSTNVASDTGEEPNSKRQRCHDNNTTFPRTTYCTWQGKLCDWKNHTKNDCEFFKITCDVMGCNFIAPRRDMSQHKVDNIHSHVNLMVTACMRLERASAELERFAFQTRQQQKLDAFQVQQEKQMDSIMKQYEKQLQKKLKPLQTTIDKLQDTIEEQKVQAEKEMKRLRLERKEMVDQVQRTMKFQQRQAKIDIVQLHLISFCRQWCQRRPDALYDFVVYKPSITRWSAPHSDDCGPAPPPSSSPSMTKLLFGIPGPKRTSWGGGLFPLLMQWDDISKPPICRFPPGFSHVNVHTSTGTVHLSTLDATDSWDPEISIPELMFDIQQLLVHPNPGDPSSNIDIYHFYMNDVPRYTALLQAQTAIYSSHDQPTTTTTTPETTTTSNNNKAFLRRAVHAFPVDEEYGYNPEDDSEDNWCLVSDRKPSDSKQSWSPQTRPTEPTVQPNVRVATTTTPTTETETATELAVGDEDPSSVGIGDRPSTSDACPCSCCAWGSSFWDSRHEMRFLYGCGR